MSISTLLKVLIMITSFFAYAYTSIFCSQFLMSIFNTLCGPAVPFSPYQKMPKQSKRECCRKSSQETKPEQPSICCCANSLTILPPWLRAHLRWKLLRLSQICIVTIVWLQGRPFPFCSTHRISDTGSNRHCRTGRVCLVGLSKKFISISKSRCSNLWTSKNWWYKGQ